ncbi:MAG: SDR family NAD(P)-dependent oxidoreductase [Tumebacillaceae bacterium]
MNQPKKPLALVTGSNRGIGLELVKQLAASGYHVVLGSRRANAEEISDSLRAQGFDVSFLLLDVDDLDSINHAARIIEEQHGRIDVLINNAGVYLDEGIGLLDVPIDVLEKTMKTNLMGPYYLSRAILPMMQKQKYGRIVNISSGYGSMEEMRHQGTGAYKLSKLALNGMTQLLAVEVSGNVKINAVCPGWVRTDMGGPHASRSVEDAVKSILWLVTLDEKGPHGGFFRDGQPISW